jgi:hypothetical protein
MYQEVEAYPEVGPASVPVYLQQDRAAGAIGLGSALSVAG